MHAAWIRFAESGDPNGGSLPDWPTYEVRSRPTMRFDKDIVLLLDPREDERRAWDGVPTEALGVL